jgi:hypothetical protein
MVQGRNLKNFIIIALFIFLVIGAVLGIARKNKLSDETPVTEPVIKASNVAVDCGDLSGCGNIIKKSNKALIIVTAGHILDGSTDSAAPDLRVTFYDGAAAKAKVLKQSKELDVAILEVKTRGLPGKGKGYPAALGENSAKGYGSGGVGSEMAMGPNVQLLPDMNIFLRNALEDQVYAGVVELSSVYSEDFGREMIVCYCSVDPGMSGTGLFDEAGNYLGMLLGTTDEGEAVCLESGSIEGFLAD